MARVREYSESIALDRASGGAHQPRRALRQGVGQLPALLAAQKRLTWFTTGFGQAAAWCFRSLSRAPRFSAAFIQLGELMQIASAFGACRTRCPGLWTTDRLASWRATTDRLTSFESAFTGNIDAKPSAQWSTMLSIQDRPNHRPRCSPARRADVGRPEAHGRAG